MDTVIGFALMAFISAIIYKSHEAYRNEIIQVLRNRCSRAARANHWSCALLGKEIGDAEADLLVKMCAGEPSRIIPGSPLHDVEVVNNLIGMNLLMQYNDTVIPNVHGYRLVLNSLLEEKNNARIVCSTGAT